jgi:hypothetical protein
MFAKHVCNVRSTEDFHNTYCNKIHTIKGINCTLVIIKLVPHLPYTDSETNFHCLNPIHSRYVTWTADQPVARPPSTYRTTNHRKTLLGFETMTLVFKKGKTVHAPDRSATVIGESNIYYVLERVKKLPDKFNTQTY